MTSRKPCSDASLPCSHLVERINKGDGVIVYRPLGRVITHMLCLPASEDVGVCLYLRHVANHV
jgi:hypothetical protein